MRTVIQVGLYKTAEWSYLVEDNWHERMKAIHAQFRLPDFYAENPEPFRYIGIDVSPTSVLETRRAYEHLPNTKFLACGVSETFALHAFHNKNYDPNKKDMAWNEHLPEQENMIFPFMPFRFIIEHLDIENLTVLAIDVDGYEDELFSEITGWRFRPELISVEGYAPNTRNFDSILHNHGYILIKTHENYTQEDLENSVVAEMRYIHQHIYTMTFVRKDIFQKHKEEILFEFSACTL